MFIPRRVQTILICLDDSASTCIHNLSQTYEMPLHTPPLTLASAAALRDPAASVMLATHRVLLSDPALRFLHLV